VLLGLIASISLILLELNLKHRKLLTSTEINFLANHISDLSRSMLQLEVDSVLLLLILNKVRIVHKKNNKRAILTSISI
jgi:formate-dependent nitrite reductase membrane component NrfD